VDGVNTAGYFYKKKIVTALRDPTETPKASRGWGMGKAIPLPSRTVSLGSVVSSPSEVRGSPETILVISRDRRRPLPEKLVII